MKSNLLRTFFEWALITSVLMSVGFFYWFWTKSRQVRSYQNQIGTAEAGIQQNNAVMRMLWNESEDYAKTHPELTPVLQSLLQAQPAAPSSAPVAKKPAK